jgi:hypothetical protein
VETQPHVIGDPGAGFVHQDRPQQIDDFAPRSRPVRLHRGTEKIFGKGVQPGFEAGW